MRMLYSPADGFLCIGDPVSWTLQLSFVKQASGTSAVSFATGACRGEKS